MFGSKQKIAISLASRSRSKAEVSFDESVLQIRDELLFRWSLTIEQVIPFYTLEDCLSEVRTVDSCCPAYSERASRQRISSSNSDIRIWIPSFRSTRSTSPPSGTWLVGGEYELVTPVSRPGEQLLVRELSLRFLQSAIPERGRNDQPMRILTNSIVFKYRRTHI